MANARRELRGAGIAERGLAKYVSKGDRKYEFYTHRNMSKYQERALRNLLRTQAPIAEIQALFDKYAKHWSRRLDLAISLGQDDKDVLYWLPDLCYSMGTQRARELLENAIPRIEASMATLKVLPRSCSSARVKAAELAVGLADDVVTARKHLQRAAQLDKKSVPDPVEWPTFSAGGK
jgi:hypothetical protein